MNTQRELFEAWAAKEGLSDSEAGVAEVAWRASWNARGIDLYEAVRTLLEAPGTWTSGYADALHGLREAFARCDHPLVVQAPIAEVSSKSFNSDGTSNVITPALPLGTKLYPAPTPPARPEVP